FHQCVRLSRFENDRTISFIPPDGEFEHISCRFSSPVEPLIWVEAAMESHTGSRLECIVKAHFKRRSSANNVEIYVPVPDDTEVRYNQYAPGKSAFVWKIKQLGESKEFSSATFLLPIPRIHEVLYRDGDKHAPITVKFEIPYFTVFGIEVR
ncbi:Mu homology domain-containing protein, partial [Ephemerocybe angulata]